MPDSHTPGDFFVAGTPHITPHHVLDVRARRLGIERDDLRLPPTFVATFFRETAHELALAAEVDPAPIHADRDIWKLSANQHLAVGRIPIGAPFAASFFEQIVAAGVERLIVIGAAGSLQATIDIGQIVIPTDTIREEGTSYHYLPADEPARAHIDLADRLYAAAAALTLPGAPQPHRGLHWTTDAIFREQEEKISAFRERGVLSVDMEVSALYAVAQHLGVECVAILAISDVLNPAEGWRHFGASPTDLDQGLEPVETAQSPSGGSAGEFEDPGGGPYGRALSLAVQASMVVARA